MMVEGESSIAVSQLLSCGTQAPECSGSVVATHQLSCPMACGILVPQPGIKSEAPALEGGFLTPEPPEKSSSGLFTLCLLLPVPEPGALWLKTESFFDVHILVQAFLSVIIQPDHVGNKGRE